MSRKVIIQLVSLPDDGVTPGYTGVGVGFIPCDLPSHKGGKTLSFNEVCQLLTQIGVNLINFNPIQWKHLRSLSVGAFLRSEDRRGQ